MDPLCLKMGNWEQEKLPRDIVNVWASARKPAE